MTSAEIFHIYTKLSEVMDQHHLKDALPMLKELKEFVGEMYKEIKEEEKEMEESLLSRSDEDLPTPSDEEFIASEESIDYESEPSSQSQEDSECSEGSSCSCEACKSCL